ncbi:MAG: hypothetical protein F2817_01355 [Actinobacteria bacterium]|nr:hypothetical protein [Actinomycetota bacterium]
MLETLLPTDPVEPVDAAPAAGPVLGGPPVDPLDHAYGRRRARIFRGAVLVIAVVLVIAAAPSDAFTPLAEALAAVSAISAAAWVVGRRRSPGTPFLGPTVTVADVALVTAIVAASGGADSPVRWLLACTPLLWAFTRPKDLRLVIVSGAAGYVAASMPELLTPTADLRRTMAGFFVAYTGAAAAAVLMSAQRRTQHSLLWRMRRMRTELHGQHLARERRHVEDLVGRLHDGSLQLVATVGQDLDDHLAGTDVDLVRSRRLLREAMVEMRTMNASRFDGVVGEADLAAALRKLATRVERRGGPHVVISVGRGVAGRHDGVLQAATRELLANAVKHARASEVGIDVACDAVGRVVLTVTDDGVGIAPRARREAEAAGHTGLRHLERRVAALGGDVRILTGPAGTTTRIRLPGEGPGSGDPGAPTAGEREIVAEPDAAPTERRPLAGRVAHTSRTAGTSRSDR